MDIKTFKLAENGIMCKIILSRFEAIGISSKGYHKARKELIKLLIQNLLELPEIDSVVKDNNVVMRKDN